MQSQPTPPATLSWQMSGSRPNAVIDDGVPDLWTLSRSVVSDPAFAIRKGSLGTVACANPGLSRPQIFMVSPSCMRMSVVFYHTAANLKQDLHYFTSRPW